MASRLYKVGFIVTDTVGDLKGLNANATANNYDCFENNGTNFQINASKTLYIGKIIFTPSNAATRLAIGYGDTAVDNGAGAPTNYISVISGIYGTAAAGLYELEVYHDMPSSKYPHLREVDSGISRALMYGIEI